MTASRKWLRTKKERQKTTHKRRRRRTRKSLPPLVRDRNPVLLSSPPTSRDCPSLAERNGAGGMKRGGGRPPHFRVHHQGGSVLGRTLIRPASFPTYRKSRIRPASDCPTTRQRRHRASPELRIDWTESGAVSLSHTSVGCPPCRR